jgi:phage/plasmid primase-like uncharacterized protein
MIARDIIPPEPILADGRLHRCNAAGRHGKGDATYVLHLDGLPASGFENHRDGRDWETWRFNLGGLPTAASLHEACGYPVVIAFHAGNLGMLATALRARYPGARIVACANDDHRTAGNPGRTHAADAGRVIGGPRRGAELR